MRVSLLSPARRSGATMYAEKLAGVLGASIVPANRPLGKLVAELRAGSDVVDIQLEYGTFGSHLRTIVELPVLVLRLRRKVKVVVTFHGVLTLESLEGQSFRRLKLLAFELSARLTGWLATKLVVHTEEMERQLHRYGAKNTVVIPHGTGPLAYASQSIVRANLLFFGFIRPSKGLEELLGAFEKVAGSFPEVTLTIAGGTSRAEEGWYLDRIAKLASDPSLRKRVTLETGFIDDAGIERLAAGSSVLVLPYKDAYLEASGVLHDFAGRGMAVICSRTPRFSELRDGLDCLKSDPTPSSLSSAITRALKDLTLREALARSLYEMAERESWERVGEARLSLYAALK